MILDYQAVFSVAQAITATAASTNSIDLGAPGIVPGQAAAMPVDYGKGYAIPLLIQVVQSFNNLTSLKIDIELDTTTTFTPDKTITVGTYLLAQLTAGFIVDFKYVPTGITMQYMQLKYTVSGTAPTLGQITAGIVPSVQTAP
jgi:hypothetical protein